MRVNDCVGRVVHVARELGWFPHERNHNARKHFYFHRDGSCDFSVIMTADGGLFTVGQNTTSDVDYAVQLLRQSPVSAENSVDDPEGECS